MKMEDVRATEATQEHSSCSELEGQLAFMAANFSSLTEGIKCLQQKGEMLEDLIVLLKKVAINS
jgi:hypothetical protein